MICQILFPGECKKNTSKCCLLKILPRVQSVKRHSFTFILPHQVYLDADRHNFLIFFVLLRKCTIIGSKISLR